MRSHPTFTDAASQAQRRADPMLSYIVDTQSFGLGFVFGTSVYVAASSAAYVVFSAARQVASLFRR